MGSAYTLIEQDAHGIGGLEVLESSNKLELITEHEYEGSYPLTEEIAPADLMRIFLKGLTVCSYWMSSEEFAAVLAELEDYSM